MILAAGYRIASFDIESIIAADPEVAEVAVVERPDEIRGEVVGAFVTLRPGASAAALQERLQNMVRVEHGGHACPRRIHVVASLPKTPSGKIQRFVLRRLSEDEMRKMTAP